MAEGFFHSKLEGSNINVSSAGIDAVKGVPAVAEAQKLMLSQNIDISQHRARQLTTQMLLKADLILVMENYQKKHIENMLSEVCGRVFLLGKWGDYEIPDPYRKSEDFFVYNVELIEKSWEEWREKLWV